MTVVYAVKNGNWSDPTTWNTGQLPQPGNTVCANGYTVNIDQDVDLWVNNQPAGIITTRAYSPAVAGGGFACSRDNTIIKCQRIEAYTTALTISASECTIYGDVYGSNHTSSQELYGIVYNGTGTLQIYGSVYGGTIAYNHTGIINSNAGTVRVVGNVVAGSRGFCFGISNSNIGTVDVTGNVIGGGDASAHGILNANAGVINVVGNVIGGTGSNAFGINNTGTGIVNITGNVRAGSGTSNIGVNNASVGVININGTAHYGKAAPAIYSTANGTLRVVGDLYADPAPAIVWTGSGAYCAIDGNEYGGISGAAQGNVAACVYKRAQPQTKNRFIRVAEADDTLSGYSGQAGFFYGALYPTLNHPSESDVRYGVTYGPNNELTGTCHVPPPQSVLYGVPVDNTTGLAAVTPEAIAAAVWNFSQIDSSLTARQLLALIAAVLAGKVDVNENVVTFYAPGSSTTQRLVATVDSQGNRLQITLYPPD